MMIYFCGDSNTEGAELDNPETESYASVLSTKLNANYINQASGGASNTKILRLTESYLQQCKSNNALPDFIVIGWSDWDRQDWFHNHEYYSINSFGVNHPDQIDPPRTRYYNTNIKDNILHIQEMIKFFNNSFYNLHCELMDMGIPHLFFNAIQSLGQYKSMPYQFDWKHCYMNPYEQKFAYTQWAENSGYQQITPGKYHFQPEAHSEWANILYKYILEHSLLER